jgi:hypothetical protein
MKITLRLFATLRDYLPAGNGACPVVVDLPEGATIPEAAADGGHGRKICLATLSALHFSDSLTIGSQCPNGHQCPPTPNPTAPACAVPAT